MDHIVLAVEGNLIFVLLLHRQQVELDGAVGRSRLGAGGGGRRRLTGAAAGAAAGGAGAGRAAGGAAACINRQAVEHIRDILLVFCRDVGLAGCDDGLAVRILDRDLDGSLLGNRVGALLVRDSDLEHADRLVCLCLQGLGCDPDDRDILLTLIVSSVCILGVCGRSDLIVCGGRIDIGLTELDLGEVHVDQLACAARIIGCIEREDDIVVRLCSDHVVRAVEGNVKWVFLLHRQQVELDGTGGRSRLGTGGGGCS